MNIPGSICKHICMYRNIHLLFSDFDSVLWLYKRIYQGRETQVSCISNVCRGKERKLYTVFVTFVLRTVSKLIKTLFQHKNHYKSMPSASNYIKYFIPIVPNFLDK